MPPSQQPNNPYASAAGAYGNNAQKHAVDPREMEARVLLKAAQFMQDLQNEWSNAASDDIADILKYNRSIWMMFFDNAMENPDNLYPDDLRANIASLSNFIFKRETDILVNPAREKLDILININRNIAEGLMKGVKAAPITPASPAPANTASDAQTKTPPVGGGGTDTSA